MTTSTKLGVPYIASSQASPEVPHNLALYMLEAMVRGAKALQNAPPGGTPADGDVYIVGTAGSGAWAGKNNCIAVYVSNAWRFVPGFDSDGAQIAMGADQEGMRIWNQATDELMRWTGAAWTGYEAPPLTTVAGLPAAPPTGTRGQVSDANATHTAGIGAVVVGGGANNVPVRYDGAAWRIG